MPNHITNRLIVEGATDEVAKVFDFIKAEKSNEAGVVVLIDFNKIVPMPESLDVESSSEGTDGKQYLLGMSGNVLEVRRYEESDHYKKMKELQEQNPERFERCIELGRKYLRNTADFGCTTWYDWRCRNWGSKWNAYDIEKPSYDSIMFKTAWNGVPSLICKLGAMFPAVTIRYDYADEDTSYNTGSYIIHGDDVQDNSPKNASPEAWELVFDLGVADIDDYVEQPDGTYKYIDDEENDE